MGSAHSLLGDNVDPDQCIRGLKPEVRVDSSALPPAEETVNIENVIGEHVAHFRGKPFGKEDGGITHLLTAVGHPTRSLVPTSPAPDDGPADPTIYAVWHSTI